jgi:uncharacterized membrane protein
MSVNYIRQYLSTDDLHEIQSEISKVEKSTSGELRLCLRKSRGLFEKKFTPREIAVNEFHKLGMHNTDEKTGVLIFILFSDRKFEIVADEGINSKIPEEKWELITSRLRNEFSSENYKNGILLCLNEIKDILAREFPYKEGDKNELSDEIVIE